eukprot:NODE_149_length_17312_cov_0.399349.p1 type:complete len:944 gc:universal NODE_149_length_17312_cov_0.399349:391-3222(+)
MSSFNLQESQLSFITADMLASLPEDMQSRVRSYKQLRNQLRWKEENKSWIASLNIFNIASLFSYLFFGPGIILFIILDVCVDVPFLILYIIEIETSTINRDLHPIGMYVSRKPWIYDLCIMFSCFNILSFIGRTISAKDKFFEVVSWHSLVDILTCIPFIVSLFIPFGSFLFVPYFLRSLIVIKRIRRLLFIQLELRKTSKFTLASVPNTGITERLVSLISAILVILYVSGCAVEYVEAVGLPDAPRLGFLEAMYLMIVTGSTVGYGDITPQTTAGKFIIVIFIIVTITVLPTLIGRLIETIRRTQQGGGSFEDTNSRFVVIFGSLDNFRSVVDILDFFQSDLELENVKIVLVGSDKVNDDVSALITLPTFANQVFYLKGSALRETDLLRAKVQYADACFVLCDRDKFSAEKEDDHNCLRVWSLKRFSPNTKVFSIVRTPRAQHFQRAADVVICIDIIKTVLLAFSCLNPGASTFITNLMNSFVARSKINSKWVMEYNDGCCNEMYTCSIVSHLTGFSFYNIAPFLYEHFQVLLIGVRVWSRKYQKFVIFLNPYDYRPTLEDEFIVIAQSPKDVEFVENMEFEYFCKMYKEPSIVLELDTTTFNEFPVVSDEYVHAVPFREFSSSKRTVCHLLKNACSMENRTLMNAKHLSNHILIIPADYNIGAFMTVMRSAILQKSEFFDVLILFNRYPTEDEYKLLSRFPRLYFIVGNPRNMNDLETAGALSCSRVVIFTQSEPTHAVKDFDDAPALMIKHSITTLWQEHDISEKSVLVELTERRNVRHLSSESLKQANFFTRKLLKSKSTSQQHYTTIEEIAHDPVFAAGDVLIDNLLDNIIYHSYKGSHAFDLVKTLCGIRLQEDLELSKEMGIPNGYMYKEMIPMEYWEVSFAEFFRVSLTMHKRVAVAIYRPPNAERGNNLPYIYTAPIPIVKLKKGDAAFYIGNR